MEDQGTDWTYRVVFPVADDVPDPLFLGRLCVQFVPHQEAAVLDVEGDEAILEQGDSTDGQASV